MSQAGNKKKNTVPKSKKNDNEDKIFEKSKIGKKIFEDLTKAEEVAEKELRKSRKKFLEKYRGKKPPKGTKIELDLSDPAQKEFYETYKEDPDVKIIEKKSDKGSDEDIGISGDYLDSILVGRDEFENEDEIFTSRGIKRLGSLSEFAELSDTEKSKISKSIADSLDTIGSEEEDVLLPEYEAFDVSTLFEEEEGVDIEDEEDVDIEDEDAKTLGEWREILKGKYGDFEEGLEEALEEVEDSFRGYKPPSYKELGQFAREFQKAKKLRYKPKEDLTKYQIPKGGYTAGAIREAYKKQKNWDVNIKYDRRNDALIMSFRAEVEDLPRGIETIKKEFNKIADMMELVITGRLNVVSEPKVSGGIFMTRMTAPVKKKTGKELRRNL